VQILKPVDHIVVFNLFYTENGLLMFLWVGANVAHEWTQSVFGDHLAAKIEIDPSSLPVFDNQLSRRLRQVIDLIRAQRHRSMKVNFNHKYIMFSCFRGKCFSKPIKQSLNGSLKTKQNDYGISLFAIELSINKGVSLNCLRHFQHGCYFDYF
jgi:hypothetical protein